MVKAVNYPGFGLHLDTGRMTLNQADPAATLTECEGMIAHFHLSEPYLDPVGLGEMNYQQLASTLNKVDYPLWVSIKMRHNPEIETPPEIERVLTFLKTAYDQGS